MVTRLLIFWSSLSWLRPPLVADLTARPPKGTFWCHVLALPPDRKELSRLWVSLFGMVFPLTFVLCHGTFPILFINSSRLSSLAKLGWERLWVVTLKGHYINWYIDRSIEWIGWRDFKNVQEIINADENKKRFWWKFRRFHWTNNCLIWDQVTHWLSKGRWRKGRGGFRNVGGNIPVLGIT